MTVDRVIARNHIDPSSVLADDIRRLAADHPTRSPDSPDPHERNAEDRPDGTTVCGVCGTFLRHTGPDPRTVIGPAICGEAIKRAYAQGQADAHSDCAFLCHHTPESFVDPPRSPDSPDPLWDDIYGEDGTARLLPGPPEVMSEADRRIASIAPRSSDSVRTPDLDVPERLCPHGTRWNYTCDECEKVVEWYAAVNDLYLVTHLHESDDCAECLAALHPASPPQEGTE
jgi:hypothetical protein